MADEQHPVDKVNDLVNLAYIYQQDGAFFTSAAKLREAADLMEQHIHTCTMELHGLVQQEVDALRILNGEDLGQTGGAWLNACCETLKEMGYAEGSYTITQKGKDFLKEMHCG